jgi:hypothetical protein
MKQGIHLGRPPARSSLFVKTLLLASAAAALVLAVLYLEARAEADALASEVQSLEQALASLSPHHRPDGERLVAARLRLALDSGAAGAVSPTELLRLAESALPEGVVLGRLSFNASPQPVLTLEAATFTGDRVTEMQRRLLASPSVATASLLEERLLADGRLGVRIQVGLARR